MHGFSQALTFMTIFSSHIITLRPERRFGRYITVHILLIAWGLTRTVHTSHFVKKGEDYQASASTQILVIPKMPQKSGRIQIPLTHSQLVKLSMDSNDHEKLDNSTQQVRCSRSVRSHV